MLVFGINDWFRDGAQAEYCAARAAEVAPKPRSVDHVAAAVAPISALTAWQGLIERAGLTAGQRVLIHGASGAVGTFAVQLARWRGAARDRHGFGEQSGARARLSAPTEAIDYRAVRFDDVVRDVDVVFDTVGGETLARSWGVLKSGGKLISIAASEEQSREPRVRDAFFIVEAHRTQLEEVARLIDAGELRPIVGAVFPLARAQEAYELKLRRGKAVLRVVD